MTTEAAIDAFLGFVAMNNDWSEAAAVESLVAAGVTQGEADDVVQLTPVAFGRAILDGMGIQFGSKYFCFRGDGSVARSGDLNDREAFRVASAQARVHFQHPAFRTIALSSSELNAVNQALHAGSNPSDLVMAPVGIFIEPPTDAGLQLAQHRIADYARMVAKKVPAPNAQSIKKPWWRFW